MCQPPECIDDHENDFIKHRRNHMINCTIIKVGLSWKKRLVGEETRCKGQQAYGNQKVRNNYQRFRDTRWHGKIAKIVIKQCLDLRRNCNLGTCKDSLHWVWWPRRRWCCGTMLVLSSMYVNYLRYPIKLIWCSIKYHIYQIIVFGRIDPVDYSRRAEEVSSPPEALRAVRIVVLHAQSNSQLAYRVSLPGSCHFLCESRLFCDWARCEVVLKIYSARGMQCTLYRPILSYLNESSVSFIRLSWSGPC